jgi:hypothetical protein
MPFEKIAQKSLFTITGVDPSGLILFAAVLKRVFRTCKKTLYNHVDQGALQLKVDFKHLQIGIIINCVSC